MGPLSDFVTDRLRSLPEGSPHPADLGSPLITERVFGPLGAAVRATRLVVLATHPTLREDSDRIDDAEEALEDSVAVGDPRVAQVASERLTFESALQAVIEELDLAGDDDDLFGAWDAVHPVTADDGTMPYDFSPARLRCRDLAEELSARDAPTT